MRKSTFTFFTRTIALFTASAMLFQSLLPYKAFALTGGPKQPEFSSFTPVGTNNMVNESTGDFSYNLPVIEIPGTEGAGYALSLSYNSGVSPEEEASWVGYGWSLNPGAMVRQKRGYPDDKNGGKIIKYNKMPPNITTETTLSAGFQPEVYGFDIPAELNSNIKFLFNTRTGFACMAGTYASFALGPGSVHLGMDQDGVSANYDFNPFNFSSAVAAASRFSSNSKLNSVLNRAAYSVDKSINGAIKASLTSPAMPTYISESNGFSIGFSLSFHPTLAPSQIGTFSAAVLGNLSFQVQDEETEEKCYGYIYTSNASQNDLLDYSIEKESPFTKRDNFMSIPYSGKDIWSVSAEGLGITVMPQSKTPVHFYTDAKGDTTVNVNLGIEGMAGLDQDIGFNIGFGVHTMGITEWFKGNNYRMKNDIDEGIFYSSYADPVLNMDFGGTEAVQFNLSGGGVPGSQKYDLSAPQDLFTMANNDDQSEFKRMQRSIFIDFHTNEEMATSISESDKPYKRYERSSENNNFINRNSSDELDEDVAGDYGEAVIYNNNGSRYVFGLPVYTRNEKNLSFNIDRFAHDASMIAYKNVEESNGFSNAVTTAIGEMHQYAYAGTLLLTEITNTDYIDRTMNGPSDDDFGGYVKFAYEQLYGSKDADGKMDANDDGALDGDWYHYRVPYTGLLYKKANDPREDMISCSSGDKEVYYLSRIETKTHYAEFITSDRKDGMEAAADDVADQSDSENGTKKLKKLDAINLYAKNVNGTGDKLLRTVRFEYDYSLCGNVPNNNEEAELVNSQNINANKGKLTLKKVWFENEGVQQQLISPYQFEYAYPGNNTYPELYNDLDNYGNGKIENPDYSEYSQDRWGNYCKGDDGRFMRQNPYVNQFPDADFDPAAWHLKRVILPSQGELHIQYEQKEYSFVQNRPAMYMASIKPDGSALSGGLGNNTFILNLDDLKQKVNGTESAINTDEIVSLIQKEFIDKNKKIFFRFAYNMLSKGENDADILSKCGVEYIDGYVNVAFVSKNEDGDVEIHLGGTGDVLPFPKTICEEHYKNSRVGFFTDIDAACMASDMDMDVTGFDTNDSLGALSQFEKLIAKIADPTVLMPEVASICGDIDEANSYVRIPLLPSIPKKGGGIRVKRILMYDKGNEAGAKQLLGSEYKYETIQGFSSGVASNEPPDGREENALVNYADKRDEQSFTEVIISGRDKEQFEGPWGEHILPGPSVGYSRVVKLTIWNQKTNDGIIENEFYTYKDFPFDGYYAGLDQNGVEYTNVKQENDILTVPAVVANVMIQKYWATQGYSFIKYDINGKPKKTTTYKGKYEDYNQVDKLTIAASVEYDYYKPGENITIKKDLTTEEAISLPKSMEVVMDSRNISDKSGDGREQLDFSIGTAGPILIPGFSLVPYFNWEENELYTHVTTKITTYPVLVKSVKTIQDGSYNNAQNLAYDFYSGESVLTTSTGEYDRINIINEENQSVSHLGSYYSLNFPATWFNYEMRNKAISEGATIKWDEENLEYKKPFSDISDITKNNSSIIIEGDICTVGSLFTPGDLLLLKLKRLEDDLIAELSDEFQIYIAGDYSNSNSISILPTNYFYHNEDEENTNYKVTELTILRSGKTQQLSTNVANITTYGISPEFALNETDHQHYENRKAIIDQMNDVCSQGTLNTPVDIDIANEACDVNNDNFFITKTANGFVTITYNNFCSTDPFKVDVFDLNDEGQIIYNYDGCTYDKLCIEFCPKLMLTADNVVSASASFFSDEHELSSELQKVYGLIDADGNYTYANEFESGARGKWRPQINYMAKGNLSNGKTYEAGLCKDFILPSFTNSALNVSNPNWVKTDSVTAYSPNGSVLSQMDVIGISSIAKYGNNLTSNTSSFTADIFPYLIVANAQQNNTQFESFEAYKKINMFSDVDDHEEHFDCQLNDNFTVPEENGSVSTTIAHAGKNSIKLFVQTLVGYMPLVGTNKYAQLSLKSLTLDKQLYNEGISVKVWVKSSEKDVIPTLIAGSSYSFIKIAQTGEWILYEAKIQAGEWTLDEGISFTPSIKLSSINADAEIYIDDLRLQPLDAQATAYVYDENLRLTAQFDDQHFALFYQYDGEGKLIRKIVETELGTKTIQEAQYHTPTLNRTDY